MVFPIAVRELRVAARHWSTYYGRLVIALVCFAVLGYLLWIFRKIGTVPVGGGYLLRVFAYIAFAFCAFSGLRRTSDALSSEKRADTLGLLFLTHLSGWDIVLGKLLAQALRVFYGLVAAIPVASVMVLLGGVSGGELLRLPITLLNTLLLSLSVGLLVSTFTRNQRSAMGIATGSMALMLALPFLGQQLEEEFERPGLALFFSIPSPWYAQGMAFSNTIGLQINYFWVSVGVQFCLSLLALAVSAWSLPLTWQVKADGSSQLRLKERLMEVLYGARPLRTARRAWMLTRNPILWLNCRDRLRPLWPVLFLVALIGATIGVILYYEIPREGAVVLGFAVCVVFDFFMKSRVAAMASSRLGEDRQSGALEMILATPTSVREIIRGYWMSIRKVLLPGYLTFIALYLAYSLTVLHLVDGQARHYTIVFGLLAISICDFINCGWSAMWSGMRLNQAAQAPGRAMFHVAVLPWVAFMLSMPILAQVETLQLLFAYTDGVAVAVLAFAFWSANSIYLFRRARLHLLTHFREAATDRYTLQARIGWVQRLKRLLTLDFRRAAVKPMLQ